MKKIYTLAILLLILLSAIPATEAAPADTSPPQPLIELKEISADPLYHITLNIFGPDGLPAADPYVLVYRGYPWDSDIAEVESTATSGVISFDVPRGRHIAVLKGPNAPKFLALFYFYVTAEASYNVYVADLTTPVNLKAVKPLDGRPFTDQPNQAYFWIHPVVYSDITLIYYAPDTAGNLRIYLPKNARLSFAYQDRVSRYGLYVKSYVPKKAEATVEFDASKTGFVRPVFIPTAGSEDPDRTMLIVKGKDIPRITFSTTDEWDPIPAVTSGRYELGAKMIFEEVVDGVTYIEEYEFTTPRFNVRAKKESMFTFGGDLKGVVKPNKRTFKPGETIEIDYWFEDAYRNRLWAEISEWQDGEFIDYYYPPLYLNVYDTELVESKQLDGYPPEGTLYLYTKFFAQAGVYKIEVEMDTEHYQPEAKGSAIIAIR